MRDLAGYARIPISFQITAVLDVEETDGGFALTERRLAAPRWKDFDAIPGEGPANWAASFDVSNWGVLAARCDGRRVGGAVIAHDTPGLRMLEGRTDLAALWDLRVAPASRHQGVGAALFAAAEAWALARGCGQLRVETQNVNVTACRFYESHGCRIETVNRTAYAEFSDEIQIIYTQNLM